ncbi:MAG TPA: 4-hydroxythreonine-4-phosphate dehydrogenase PdxA [Coxiellaceae bacterium]|nr:MAG: 4-hydroxythreonine-4-phosphate dehydrogenase PdxA [Gammaproteobacteria bacterium RIFCSPHIGHO2_12_FULL_36_30]HLB55735.1 4-hydroxythreonine-4-phosphate dehydrogenase PdxA [Coxiellaceae bacterium]
MKNPIALTLGEPAGIGPDIILKLWQEKPDLFLSEKIIIVGNKKLLRDRAALLNISCDLDLLNIVDIPLSEKVIPGQLNKKNAAFIIEMLTYVAKNAVEKKFSAIVTAPIHKGILNDAGFDIKGHTDFFSRYTKSKTVMMLMTDKLKVALLTDHVALRNVSDLITENNLSDCLDIIIDNFKNKLKINDPRILICGLNPHAGENGYLGLEEKEIIIPVVKKYREKGFKIMGPIGADVAFTKNYSEKTDVVLAMYHDQGLPVVKYSGFDDAINVTLGLPFVRTSVDHGTALDIAGTGKANTMSLYHAIKFAKQITDNG